MRKKYSFILLVITLIFGAIFRFYKLDKIPGEIFGDIVENLNHIKSVLNGNWHILYGYDAREGMIFFLTAPFALLLGNTYLTLKFICALVGMLTILTVYFTGREFVNEEVGLLAAFLIAVSKWPVIFSRLGFRTVLTPLFVSLTLYFFLRAYKGKKTKDFLLTGLFLGLGLYTYPAFRFFVFSIFLIFLMLFIFNRTFVTNNLKKLAFLSLVFFFIALPMSVDYI